MLRVIVLVSVVLFVPQCILFAQSSDISECQIEFSEKVKLLNRQQKLWKLPEEDANEKTDLPLFFISGDLKINRSENGPVMISHSFQPQCHYSFDLYRDESVDLELQLFNAVLIVSRENASENWNLSAGAYPVEDLTINEEVGGLDYYRTNWRISIDSVLYYFELRSLKKLSPEILKSIFGEKAALLNSEEVIDLVDIQDHQVSSKSDATYIIQDSDSLFDSRVSSDFDEFYYKDYWVEKKGFGNFGTYYEEYTKPLRGGGEIHIRIERRNSLFYDPYGRRFYDDHWRYP